MFPHLNHQLNEANLKITWYFSKEKTLTFLLLLPVMVFPVSKLQPIDRPISPLSDLLIDLFINKALLEHSCAHLLHIIHG